MADVRDRVQVITTPAGEEMVVISRAEFERLAALAAEAEEEEAADIAAFDAARALLAAGEDETLPAEASDMILKGASVLTALRKWRGLTQQALASKAGISQSYLSSLENRERNGGAEAWAAVATALDVPERWLTRS